MIQYQSEQINELAAALSKAQGEFPKIPKIKIVDFTTRDGKRTNYKYADLADVIEAVKPILSKYGLSYSQEFRTDSERAVSLWTVIMHSSGQWKGGIFPVEIGARAQETGANITYVRRYTLCGALGIQADEDNDNQFIDTSLKKNWIMNSEKVEKLKQMTKLAGWSKSQIAKECDLLKVLDFMKMDQSQYDSLFKKLDNEVKKKETQRSVQ